MEAGNVLPMIIYNHQPGYLSSDSIHIDKDVPIMLGHTQLLESKPNLHALFQAQIPSTMQDLGFGQKT